MAEYVLRATNDPVLLTADGTFMTNGADDFGRTVAESQVVQLCDLCGEPDEPSDPLGTFKHPERFGDQVAAHGQCGEDRELELA